MVFDQNKDWFTHNITQLKKVLVEPDKIRFIVEIGNLEGRSTIWLADHCAKAKIISNLVTRRRLLKNISEHPRCDDIDLKFGKSEHELKRISYGVADFIYIDGSHEAEDVLLDGLLCWKLLKKGGIMVFDDYGLEEPLGYKKYKPSIGIDAFLSVVDCKIIHKEWQFVIQK